MRLSDKSPHRNVGAIGTNAPMSRDLAYQFGCCIIPVRPRMIVIHHTLHILPQLCFDSMGNLRIVLEKLASIACSLADPSAPEGVSGPAFSTNPALTPKSRISPSREIPSP